MQTLQRIHKHTRRIYTQESVRQLKVTPGHKYIRMEIFNEYEFGKVSSRREIGKRRECGLCGCL